MSVETYSKLLTDLGLNPKNLRAEVVQLRLWNSSMMFHINTVGYHAASWIRAQVSKNKEAIESYELWAKDHQFNMSQGD